MSNMYKVIKTEKGYVAVSSIPLQVGDTGYVLVNSEHRKNSIEEIVEVRVTDDKLDIVLAETGYVTPEHCQLIVATDDTFLLYTVPQFKVPVEEESEYYAWEQAQIIFEQEQGRKPNLNTDKDLLIVSCLEIGYKAGMKNRKYSDDDLNKAIEYGHDEMLPFEKGKYKKFLDSISKNKLVTEVVLETIDEAVRNEGEDINGDNAFRYVSKLKIEDWNRYPSGLLTVKKLIYG